MQKFTLQKAQNTPSANPDFLRGLNEQQRKAVTHVGGPLLIVAGAGSGKTRVLTYRIAYLLQQHHALPHQILALTFTNKAAREMQTRIQELIGEKASGLWMGTFHSVFSKILRFEAEKIGFTSNFSIYDTSDSENAIKLILKELGYDPKEIKPKTIHRKISDAKNQLILPDQYRQVASHSTLDDITARVYEYYHNRLIQTNAMDFDDLLIKPVQLFTEHPDVLEKYQDKFRYILIDEYQDTNHAQYKVTRLLAQKYENICVVGDTPRVSTPSGEPISPIFSILNRTMKMLSRYRWNRTIVPPSISFRRPIPSSKRTHPSSTKRSGPITAKEIPSPSWRISMNGMKPTVSSATSTTSR